MQFSRLTDMELVRRTITHPAIYEAMRDDSSPTADEFQPVAHEAIWYVGVEDEGRFMGLWMFVPLTGICWEAHTCLLPEAWGKSVDYAKACVQWVWENTTCERIVGKIPLHNRLIYRMTEKTGFHEFGVNRGSYRKGGVLCDQIWMGISKEVA